MISAEGAAKLSVSLGAGMTVELRLGLREIRLGRSREADLILPDASVSRLHARVFRIGDRYFLADTSRNGTFVDGKPVRQIALEDGLTFRIGPYQIRFWQKEGSPLHAESPTAAPSGGPSIPGAPFSAPAAPPSGPAASSAAQEENFGIIGRSPAMENLLATIRKVAVSDFPVLVEGETGSGKERVSRAIPRASARRDRPFVVVNCGAISPELIESELFGHEKGAFTGATAQRRGAFEIAHTGTIFLDEIGELPLALQPKLLRALEQKEIKRVGGNETILVDVRILAATNRNLRDEMAKKTFRDDLYYRIGAITIAVPPLRERREDIIPIARRFLDEIAAGLGRRDLALSPAAEELLASCDWPGNVRELRNAVQRAAVMAHGPSLGPADFSFLLPQGPGDGPPAWSCAEPLSRWEQAERNNLLAELTRQGWNKTKAARELGIAKSTLFEKIKKYGIKTPRLDRNSDR